jgi:hypothetical protein
LTLRLRAEQTPERLQPVEDAVAGEIGVIARQTERQDAILDCSRVRGRMPSIDAEIR